MSNFNPRSPHGERQLHAGGVLRDLGNFNPRSPHGERPVDRVKPYARNAFQSTLPARGATEVHAHAPFISDISIHAPRTGSDPIRFINSTDEIISIHAPRTGSDDSIAPTGDVHGISIHAPRTGSDVHRVLILLPENISIHAPRTGSDQHICWTCNNFQQISIHAPRTGSDFSIDPMLLILSDFNPRSPHGERRRRECGRFVQCDFNPRSPHGERQGEYYNIF